MDVDPRVQELCATTTTDNRPALVLTIECASQDTDAGRLAKPTVTRPSCTAI